MNTRLFVEKKASFRVEAESLRKELCENLQIGITGLRLVNVYDLFGFSPELVEKCRYKVFGEVVTDDVTDSCELEEGRYVAIESLPGQFDQRASSAVDCVKLIEPDADIRIRSAKLIIFEDNIGPKELEAVKKYCINHVECREKDMSRLVENEIAEVKPLEDLSGFREMEGEALAAFCKSHGLAMNADDLREIVNYFRGEGRDPSETELKILDTYWSDHCRHTTFTTQLTDIDVDESFIKEDIEGTLQLYLKLREELGRSGKGLNLMDMATIGARALKARGILDDLEVSEENNACSIYIDVDVDGRIEKWLLQFKNETHNHPTEIEPFGGAATCLGGAIRDPLSGRAYVYQAMRVTGAGDIWKEVSQTIPGKLPQRVISKKAAQGYSSYGNQIGLATTLVKEIHHSGYTAKRLEIGAVVGAVKAENVRRESPAPGDVILMFGGRTGRDGIGGATGSSKEHNEGSLESCGSEVQKGNAPEERKIQRLFRRPEVTRLIKKSNDFGAGGVCVAIGELTDGLDIWLDKVPVKYSGLNATEIAISESQERMSVVVEAKDREEFERYCREENLEVTHVANVSDSGRMRMYYGDRCVCDLSRAFIDSAGATHYAKACIGPVANGFPQNHFKGTNLTAKFHDMLSHPNICSQKGLVEMFDATIGRSTVLMPYGGRRQASETQVSVQKLPVDGYTETASMMAFGFNPTISSWSPYHGAAYAVAEACAKVVAAGGRYERMRFSYQEYFEKMTSDPHSWGKPMSALLGALKMQMELGLPSIGGKDSMSGTFGNMSVPPTLVAFGITPVKAGNVISTDFKKAGDRIYLASHTPLKNGMPDCAQLSSMWKGIEDAIAAGKVKAAWAIGEGGVAEALCKMGFGNNIGAVISLTEYELFRYSYGSILLESDCDLDIPGCRMIGKLVRDPELTVNGNSMSLSELESIYLSRHSKIYAQTAEASTPICPAVEKIEAAKARRSVKTMRYPGGKVERPIVYIPVFPGTNCDYDSAKAFRKAGAEVRLGVFCNRDAADVQASIKRMKEAISSCHILALAGGFSSGDEPDGSGKFIASVLTNAEIAAAVDALLDRGGLILGICNGFQALVKSGLLPYGRSGKLCKESPTLFRNNINRHISQIVTTRVESVASPWLKGFKEGELHSIAMSHGEGKFTVSEELAAELFANGQVAFRYADPQSGEPTMNSPYNPNGSSYAIEGIVSPDGQILGKMGHSERWEENVFKNISGECRQSIFENAVSYFNSNEE